MPIEPTTADLMTVYVDQGARILQIIAALDHVDLAWFAGVTRAAVGAGVTAGVVPAASVLGDLGPIGEICAALADAKARIAATGSVAA